MGFLRKLKEVISSGVKKLGNAAGRSVEKIGQAIHSDAIELAGFKLQFACDFGNTSWNTSASVSRTVDVHQELNAVTESIRPSASDTEAKLIDVCISEVDEILKQFINLTPCSELNMLNDNYRSEIRTELSGQVMKLIQPRLSLDNKECKAILEIYDDAQRKQKAEEFKKTILTEAEKAFKKTCFAIKTKYCKKMLAIAGDVLTSAQAESKKQEKLLQQLLKEGIDEQTIDYEREDALITAEKLSILNALAFDE